MANTTTKTKQQGKAKAVDVFKQALRALKVKPGSVFSHREYTDHIVIVTKSGQKKVWRRD